MATKKKGNLPEPSESENQFIEIVNWKKAQPRMKAGPNDWLKLYTSLLEHDGFCAMDDSARMLVMALWLYAARSGLHIFPADPDWLARKIPMLNGKPDLQPLLDAADVYGNPTPFVRYCKPPKARRPRKAGTAGTGGKGGKGGSKTGKKEQTKESRGEESRREEREQKKPLRVSEEETERKEERISPEQTADQQTETKQTAAQQKAAEPEKPENPMESEAGSAKAHYMPRPAHSAYRSKGFPQSMEDVLDEWLPEHWQDPDAEAFGWEIVRALGYPDDRNNLKARSEWGAFASWWTKVKKAAPAMVLDELRDRAISKADYVRTKAKSARNRSAVWFHIMDGELSKRGVSITQTMTQPTRASPRR